MEISPKEPFTDIMTFWSGLNVNFEHLGIELTEKERSLCDQLYKGLSYQEIADTLSISINTIRYHLKTLYLKFDVNSRAELVGRILK
jgi:DNA-binding CsgD family transcriptional regulator